MNGGLNYLAIAYFDILFFIKEKLKLDSKYI